jgi:hypothetical protein
MVESCVNDRTTGTESSSGFSPILWFLLIWPKIRRCGRGLPSSIKEEFHLKSISTEVTRLVPPILPGIIQFWDTKDVYDKILNIE